MKKTVDFSSFENPEVEAINLIRNWFGESQFNSIESEILLNPSVLKSFDLFENVVSIGGVSGYPVKVWYNRLVLKFEESKNSSLQPQDPERFDGLS